MTHAMYGLRSNNTSTILEHFPKCLLRKVVISPHSTTMK